MTLFEFTIFIACLHPPLAPENQGESLPWGFSNLGLFSGKSRVSRFHVGARAAQIHSLLFTPAVSKSQYLENTQFFLAAE